MVIFLDDIVVHGSTPAVHYQRLTWVIDTLASRHLTMIGEKCIFSASEVEFVGFRLIPGGLSLLHPPFTGCPSPPALPKLPLSWA
jgi:hypothetical protein